MILSSEEFNTWSRREEVVRYAAAHGLSISEALEWLVNCGLSHQLERW